MSLNRPRFVAAAATMILACAAIRADEPTKPAPAAWTLDEARQELALHPKDAYLQFVVMQLAKREGREQEVAQLLDRPNAFDPFFGGGRQSRVDLFSTFTGALAIQESLQLDTMRGERPGGRRADRMNAMPAVPAPPGAAPRPAQPAKQQPARVNVADLRGPSVQSHPWEKMLGDKKPDVGTLANCVPEEFWFAEFRSLAKVNDVLGMTELWSGHLFAQALGEARSQLTVERIKKQLGLFGLSPKVVEGIKLDGIAATGSDLFLAEGSDVTVLIHGKEIAGLIRLVDGLNVKAGDKRTTAEHLGVAYTRLSRDGGELNVFTANPRPDLHVRGNSEAAIKQVIAAIVGKGAKRLGESLEFRYIRTLMPRGAAEEDGFIYLSDPFIRRLTGPAVKLTERRRVLAYNHLRMIGHAALMFRTERGRAPKSLVELAEVKCAPGVFGKGELTHPDGGTYSLSADGMTGVCSKYGKAEAMTPCLERLVTEVSREEAEEYRDFVSEYSEYWRTFFDPIVLRAQASAKQFRLETLILPLIDNSIYTTMAQILGGPTVPLDILPTSQREVGGLWLRLPKKPLLDALGPEVVQKPEDKQAPSRGAKSLGVAVNDLKQIGLAVHNYHDSNGQLPPRAVVDNKGKPLLSWRVAILPYIEQQPLFNQFKLDEPWDSEHNKKLIAKMPPLYRGPNAKLNGEFKTVYLAPSADDTVFPPDAARINFAGITDGLSNTIMVVEANDDKAAVWTKPDDLPLDMKAPVVGLVRPGQDVFLALFGDGSVRRVSTKHEPADLAAAFTRAGGEVVQLDDRPARKVSAGPKTGFEITNDMKMIGLSIHNFVSAFNHLPPAAVRDKNGKLGLSWRVLILPYMDQENLYRKFKLDEAWDSEHNLKLVKEMPRTFQGLDKKLNDEGKTSFVVPVHKDTMFPPDGKKITLEQITGGDGTSNTIMAMRANDESAVVWTKPDDLVIDMKNPLKGLQRPNEEPIDILMGDGSTRRFRQHVEPVTVAAMLTWRGGEMFEVPEDAGRAAGLPPNFLADFKIPAEILDEIEAAGIDLNKLRRFVRDGVGDQLGVHVYDSAKPFDFDTSGPFGAMNSRFLSAGIMGYGWLLQGMYGPLALSLPVKDAKAVDEFLDELERWSLKLRASTEREVAMIANFVEVYRLPHAKPHSVRVVSVNIFGIKVRLYVARIDDGLYLANQVRLIDELIAAHDPKASKQKKPESAHALLRVRPENWNDVLPSYKLGWAESHRSACHANLSLLAAVNRGWDTRAGGPPDAASMNNVARIYGERPFCPDAGKYDFSADGKACRCTVHGTAREPTQPPAPAETSATARLMKSVTGVSAALTFHEDGLRAVVTIERK